MKVRTKVLFDTNIFVKLNEMEVPFKDINEKFKVYSTNAQKSEILNISDENLKDRRLKYYESISPIQLQLESGPWVDKIRWDDNQKWIDEIGENFKTIKGNSNKSNTIIDALIAEVAMNQDITLVTEERKLLRKLSEMNRKVMDLQSFLAELKK